ncbi:MAG TPA: hypothetical protein VKH19_08225 [Gemmatimonadaceae bacterium]|nr:hypothetical protein [Gemmatimonadaceae bacterium]
MRPYLVATALLLVALPLQGQSRKRRQDKEKITTEELADYGDANMGDVIRRARPNFYLVTASTNIGFTAPSAMQLDNTIYVYVGTQQEGDTSMLRFHKASEIAEVKYFKPGNAMSPLSAANARVIQLLPKDPLK